MKLLFLHTLSSNTDLFAPLAAKRFPTHHIEHDVQEHFLSKIREHDPTGEVVETIHDYLDKQLTPGFDLIICTCSTLGPIVDSFPSDKVFRVDRPMAAMLNNTEHVLVAVTLEGTVEPTKALITTVNPTIQCDFIYAKGAWEHYTNNNIDAFNKIIALTIEHTLAESHKKYEAVVLAQASMTSACNHISSTVPVLTSPNTCLDYMDDLINIPSTLSH